ncbi:MAG: TIGR02680 family protein [Chloroflexota bacterium]
MVIELLPAARPSLPLPTRERWEPLRAGIIGAWQYANQEFVFHRGRLILMGRNGMGKTKAQEMLFPFLLDARNEPYRLSPGGGTGRTWWWNLIETGRDGEPERKTGDAIVWMEFGRRGHAGAMEFATIGARLHAVFGDKRRVPIAWFMTSQRPGEDVELTVPLGDDLERRIPARREQLAAMFGDAGQVFPDRAAYIRAVDDRIFRLGSRYEGLMSLLISLRTPKLSEKLNLDALVSYLRDALPPVNDDSVRQLADALESLRDDDASLERMKRARGAVGSFLDDYGSYAVREGRFLADRVRGTEEGVRQAQERLRRAEQKVAEVVARIARLETDMASHGRALDDLAGQIAAHLETPEMKAADRLRKADEDAGAARRSEETLRSAADSLRGEAEEAAARLAAQEQAAAAARAALDAALAEASAAADRAAMGDAHGAYAAALEGDLGASPDELRRAIELRRRALDALAAEAKALADARSRLAGARSRVDEARGHLRDATARRDGARDAADTALGRLSDALVEWAAGLVEVAVADADLDRVAEAAAGGRRLADALDQLAGDVRRAVAARDGELAEQARALGARRTALARDRDAVAATKVSRPDRAATRPAERAGRAGAPLYEVVDFVPGAPDADRAGIEAALEAAALLDAWVSPDGRLGGDDDAWALAATALPGATLATVLAPAGDAVPAKTVARVLASIGIGERSDGPWVAPDGRFSLGTLAGAFRKDAAGFIGAGAQALTRARRLAELEAAIAQADASLAAIGDERKACQERLGRVRDELSRAPSDADVVRTRAALADEERAMAGEATGLERAEASVRSLDAEESKRRNALAEGLAGLGFPPGNVDAIAARDALADYKGSVGELVAAARSAAAAASSRTAAEADRDRTAGKARAAAKSHADQEREAARLEAKRDELRRTTGATADQALSRLRGLRSAERQTKEALEAATTAHGDAREQRGSLATAHDDQKHRLAEAEGKRSDAAQAFGRFAATPLFALASPDFLIEGDPRGWAVRRLVETARAAIDTSDRASFETAARIASKRAVSDRYGVLHAEIGSDFGLSIEPPTDDDLLLIDAQYGDTRVPIASLAAFLDRTIAEQQAQLGARQREILERYLYEGVGEELGERINPDPDRPDERRARQQDADGIRAPDPPALGARARHPGGRRRRDRHYDVDGHPRERPDPDRRVPPGARGRGDRAGHPGFTEALEGARLPQLVRVHDRGDPRGRPATAGSTARLPDRLGRRRRSPCTCRCSPRSPPTTRASPPGRPGCSRSTRRSRASTAQCGPRRCASSSTSTSTS